MLNDAQRFWDAIVGKVRRTAQDESRNALRLERYEVTTAANGTKMGVTLPMGTKEIFLPYSQEVASATVGTPVLVAWWGSMSNAKVYFFADGYNSPTPAAIGAVSTADVQFKLYNSVTDLGLTAGSATIAGAFASMSNYTILYAHGTEFASGELPSGFYGYVWIVKGVNIHRSSIEAKGSTAAFGDWRMFLDSNGVPTGTWQQVGLRKSVTYTAWESLATVRTDGTNLLIYLPASSLAYGTYSANDTAWTVMLTGTQTGVVTNSLTPTSIVRSSPDMICIHYNKPSTISNPQYGLAVPRGNLTITVNTVN